MALANLNTPSTFDDWYRNYAQAPAGDLSSLPPGFQQSDFWPQYQALLGDYNNPNYDRQSDPYGYGALLKAWPEHFAAGRSMADWQHTAAQSAQQPLEPLIGMAAMGGIGAGAALGAGVGATEGGVGAGTGVAGVGEGSASTAATGVTPAATTGIGGGDTGLAAGTATSGAGGIDEAAMTQAARTQALNSLASHGITTGGAGAGAGAGAGTSMSRILDGTATTADWLSVGGNVAATGLGVAGSRNAANAYNNLASQYMAFGAPSRGRYEASMTPGFDPNSIPGYAGAVDTASKGVLARLAATGGNPWGNPGGLIEANKQIISGTALPAIQQYQNQNAATGGYGAFNTAAPAAANAGVGANAGVYNAVGSGLAGLTNPQPSIYDTLARLGVQGLS